MLSSLMAMTNNAFWKLPFWGLLTVTVWLSLVPVDQLPSAFNFWDKAQHALGFAALALTGLLSYPRQIRLLIPSLVLLGLGIEYAQYLTGWRQGDWADWLADCVGLAIGSLIWKAVTSIIQTQR
jgi:VanZ family protein